VSPYLNISLELGPRAVANLLAQIDATKYDTALGEGRFTIREVLAHLADWEPIFRGRIEAALANPGCLIEPRDEGQMAIDNRYSDIPVESSLKQWTEERAASASLIRGLSKEQLDTPLLHRSNGPMVVADLANFLIGHDMYHVEQLTEYL
jgi:uncharacterized damage-inducible protein DinB